MVGAAHAGAGAAHVSEASRSHDGIRPVASCQCWEAGGRHPAGGSDAAPECRQTSAGRSRGSPLLPSSVIKGRAKSTVPSAVNRGG